MLDFSALSREEAEAYREAYVAGLPQLRERLRQRLARWGGPAADGTLDGLPAVWNWFAAELDAVRDDGLEGYPGWWVPSTEEEVRRLTRPEPSARQLRLVDEVGAYLSEVLVHAVPGSDWMTYRVAPRLRDVNQHRTMLRVGGDPLDPVGLAYSQLSKQLFHAQRGTDWVLDWLPKLVANAAAGVPETDHG
jgi:hypothetical protein